MVLVVCSKELWQSHLQSVHQDKRRILSATHPLALICQDYQVTSCYKNLQDTKCSKGALQHNSQLGQLLPPLHRFFLALMHIDVH